MKNELQTTEQQRSFIPSQWQDFDSFTAQLNQKPSQDEVSVNKMANNSVYIPIAVVEAKLDYLFKGMWKTHSWSQQVIVNEVTASMVLEVLHPSGVWLTRIGTASVMIGLKSGSEVTDIGSKQKNTLVKDIPHLKAECLKNAAKSLGKAFGRNLNRFFDDGLESETGFEDIKANMDALHSEAELLEYWKSSLNKMQRSDITVKRLFNQRKEDLKDGK